MSDQKPEYSEEDIVRLDPRDHVRRRPGMYIGGVDQRALHNIVFEVINNAIDEVFLNQCDHIWITLRPDSVINIRDNGHGLRVHNTEYGDNLLEWEMTEGNIGRIQGEYRVAGGLSGIGLSVMNALSAECTVEVARDGFLWQQSYREGVPQSKVLQLRPMREGEASGTSITFCPDFTILERNPLSYDILANRARELAYLLPNFTVTLRDEREEPAKQEGFHFPNGLADYLRDLNQEPGELHTPLLGSAEWTIEPTEKQAHKIAVDVALQYTDTIETRILGYVNTVRTSGGLHTDAVTFALSHGIIRPEHPPGLIVIVSLKHPHPHFESSINLKLLNHDVVSIVYDALQKAFWSTIRRKA